MPKTLRLAVSQSHTLSTPQDTLAALSRTTHAAAAQGVDILLFPEAYLGGYPRGCSFGATVGGRTDAGREQFLAYFRAAVDLGDVPDASRAGDWVQRRLPLSEGREYRGDGTREELERIAKETGVFVVTGLVERSGGSLYCAVVFVDPKRGVVGKRRKVMPTGSERLVWAQGSPSTLKAVVAHIKGVRVVMGAAICWENYMPLLRHSLYMQDVNLWFAPTADARDTWASLMRTVGSEGRCFVLSANMCVKKKNLPAWITTNATKEDTDRSKHAKQAQEHRRSISGASSTKSDQRARRSSQVIMEDSSHEIVMPGPAVGEGEDTVLERMQSNRQDNALERTQSSRRDNRRASVVLESEGHQLVLPAAEDANTRAQDSEHRVPDSALKRRRSSVVYKQNQHEFVLPAAGDAQEGGTNGIHLASRTLKTTDSEREEFACRGGSCIMGPFGEVLAEPLWEVDEGGLLVVDADFDQCERGRLDLDVAGSYSRNDAFKLTVEGLDLCPPP